MKNKQITTIIKDWNPRSTYGSWIDKMGMVTSGICLIHCWVFPFLLLALPGLPINEGWIHPLLGGLAILSTILFISNNHYRYISSHTMAALIAGNLLILVTTLFVPGYLSHATETGFNTAGGLFLLFAHYKSFQSYKIQQKRHE